MKDDPAGTYEKFLTEIRGQNSLSTDELAGQIGRWRTIKDSVFYYAVRDTAGNQHSTMYAKCQLLHDSLRTEFSRLAQSRNRDFHDVCVLIVQTSPYHGDKDRTDAADKARPFFSSLDSLAPSDTNRSVILTKYHRQLARVLQWRFRSKGPQKTDDYFGVKPPKKDPIINKKGMELGSRASIFRSIATQLS